jgi:hypothetical protein
MPWLGTKIKRTEDRQGPVVYVMVLEFIFIKGKES